MAGLLDNEPLEFPCPNCGKNIRQTIGWVKTHNYYTCICGCRIELRTDQFRRKIAEIEAFFDKF